MAGGNDLRFEEVQSSSARLWLGICGLAALALAMPIAMTAPRLRPVELAVLALVVVLLFLFRHWFRLTTRVDAQAVEARFPLGLARRVPLTEIAEASVVTYRPLGDFGGWGLRFGSQGTIYSAAGNRAVRLVLDDDSVLFIGSARPEELCAALGVPAQ